VWQSQWLFLAFLSTASLLPVALQLQQALSFQAEVPSEVLEQQEPQQQQEPPQERQQEALRQVQQQQALAEHLSALAEAHLAAMGAIPTGIPSALFQG
jgi:hypothetical protein